MKFKKNGGPEDLARSTEMLQPVALAGVAEPSGSAGTDASSSVDEDTETRTVSDGIGAGSSRRNDNDVTVESESFLVTDDSLQACRTAGAKISGAAMEAGGCRLTDGSAGADIRTGNDNRDSIRTRVRFTTVAEVHAPATSVAMRQPTQADKSGQIRRLHGEEAKSDRLGVIGVKDFSANSEDVIQINDDTRIDNVVEPDPVRRGSEEERTHLASGGVMEDDRDANSSEEEAIIVGTVRSAAPWYLTGWANDVEVEFMIDTGCQVTILATFVYEKMCEIHPEVELELTTCALRLVSAEKSPLTVLGRIGLNIVFPGLQCDISCVVAAIGTDGLLGTEALQSWLPHQLDVRTGQLWAEGKPTLQLHQQRSTPVVSCSLITAVVLPPDSEVVGEFCITGTRRDSCALIDPNWELTEEFGVVIGHTLVDATLQSANVLMINLGENEVVLPSGSLIGTLEPVLSVSVAQPMDYAPVASTLLLPEYLEDIVRASHPSLGEFGRQMLRELLLKYVHVFPAPGEPATGRSKTVLHEIETNNSRPVHCGPLWIAD